MICIGPTWICSYFLIVAAPDLLRFVFIICLFLLLLKCVLDFKFFTLKNFLEKYPLKNLNFLEKNDGNKTLEILKIHVSFT